MHDDFPSPAIWFTHRISYGETDTMGVLYYAEYLHIFERARSEFIRACGMSYRDVEEKDIILPVREAQCRYRSPARYDDLVQVHTAISEWGRASMRFVYEMWNEDKTRLLATGSTQHALVNRQGRPVAVPDWLRDLLGNLKERRPDSRTPKKPRTSRLFLWHWKNFSQHFLLFSAVCPSARHGRDAEDSYRARIFRLPGRCLSPFLHKQPSILSFRAQMSS